MASTAVGARPTWHRAAILVVTAAMTLLTSAFVASSASATVQRSASGADIVDIQVSFDVLNLNRSKVPCVTDGGEYQLVGSLVGPASFLEAEDVPITVYLPGSMSTVAGLFRQQGFDGHYDLGARMAELGHVSLLLDRISMDQSGKPNGWLSCIGSDADTVHQVIQHLRSGSYEINGAPGVAFETVALGGYSGGGVTAALVAHSWADVDALLLLASAASQVARAPFGVFTSLAETFGLTCAQGGDRKYGDRGPGGYSFLFENPESIFGEIEHGVRATLEQSLEREPCGQWATILLAGVEEHVGLRTVEVPVLLVGAENDPFFPPAGMAAQRDLFTNSDDVTHVQINNAAHTMVIERGMVDGRTAAERFRIALCEWLTPRGFRLTGDSCTPDATRVERQSRRAGDLESTRARAGSPGDPLPATGSSPLLVPGGMMAVAAGLARVAARGRPLALEASGHCATSSNPSRLMARQRTTRPG